MPQVRIPASVIKDAVDRNVHKLNATTLDGNVVSKSCEKAMIETEVKRIERMKQLEEDVMPFGFVQSGLEVQSFVDNDGQVWRYV